MPFVFDNRITRCFRAKRSQRLSVRELVRTTQSFKAAANDRGYRQKALLKLLLLSRACECRGRGFAACDHLCHFVEVAGADLLLMLRRVYPSASAANSDSCNSE